MKNIIDSNNLVKKLQQWGRTYQKPTTVQSTTKIKVYNYKHATRKVDVSKHENLEECMKYLEDKETVTWVDIMGLDNNNEIEKLETELKIDPILIQNIEDNQQRSTIAIDDNFVFLSFYKIYSKNNVKDENVEEMKKKFNSQSDVLVRNKIDDIINKYPLLENMVNGKMELQFERVCMIIGKYFIITLHEKDVGIITTVNEKIEREGESLPELKDVDTTHIAYSILGEIITNYTKIYDKIDVGIMLSDIFLEKQVTNDRILKIILNNRNQLRMLRQKIYPLLDSLNELKDNIIENESTVNNDMLESLKQKTHNYHLKSLINNVKQIQENHAITRDSLEIQNQQFNSIKHSRSDRSTRNLTIVATIFLPLTLLTGIYGMNFFEVDNLGTLTGGDLPVIEFGLLNIILMIVVGTLLAFYLKHKINS